MIPSFTTSNPNISKILQLSGELFDLRSVTELLHWDQETYMPPQGILHRSRQLSTMSALYHQKLTAKELSLALSRAQEEIATHPDKFTLTDKALVRELKREHDKAAKIPDQLVRDLAQATSSGLETWKQARQTKDFALFTSSLQKIVDLRKQEAHLLGFEKSPYDALLDKYEPGLTASKVSKLFTPLGIEISALLRRIQNSKNKPPKNFLRGQKFTQRSMVQVTEKMLSKIGFDFSSGRQDMSAHPFTLNFGHRDVRVTNRYLETDLASSIFSAIHEGGHALYEMGVSEVLGNTFLAAGISLGIHESQSRLWENFVGRSLPFWNFWTPYLKSVLPKQLNGATPQGLYREVNLVQPGFIRVDADEVSYNLHIILRFEIEKDIFEDKISVADLPSVWNQKMHTLLGVTPPDDALGVLQDIHWSQGDFGYFPTYTLGNLNAAQLWHKIGQDIPELSSHIDSGNFEPLLHWLRAEIHSYGSLYTPSELLEKVSGEKLDPQYFVDYLKTKYGALYKLK